MTNSDYDFSSAAVMGTARAFTIEPAGAAPDDEDLRDLPAHFSTGRTRGAFIDLPHDRFERTYGDALVMTAAPVASRPEMCLFRGSPALE